MRGMKNPFIDTLVSTFIAALCLGTIIAADAGHPLALRLQGAVTVIVGILNGLALAIMAGEMFLKEARTACRQRWQSRSPISKLYSWLRRLTWLAALAWAGWLWSFGIQLLCLLSQLAVIRRCDGGTETERPPGPPPAPPRPPRC